MAKIKGIINSMKVACVYKFTFKLDGRSYIGQTVNFGRRLREHIRAFANIAYEINHYDWIAYMHIIYHIYDFLEYFDVEILEIVPYGTNVLDELNRLEIEYIKEYGTYDPTFERGFNYTRGGSGTKRKSTGNVFVKTKNKDMKRNSCFCYDTASATVELYMTLKSAAETLSVSYEVVKTAYYRGNLVDDRYRIYPANCEVRRTVMSTAVFTSYKKLMTRYTNRDKLRNKSLSAMNANISRRVTVLSSIIKDWSKAELEIGMQYSYDTVTDSNVLSTIRQYEPLQRVLQFIHNEVSSVDLNLKYILYECNNSDLDAVYVVDTIDGTIQQFKNIRIAGKEIGLSREHILEKVRTDSKACGRYYILYVNPKLREAVWSNIRKEHPVKTAKEKDNRAKYARAYYRIGKLQGIDYFG